MTRNECSTLLMKIHRSASPFKIGTDRKRDITNLSKEEEEFYDFFLQFYDVERGVIKPGYDIKEIATSYNQHKRDNILKTILDDTKHS